MFVLVRELNDNESIFGSLFFNGAFICFTLENAKKAIPCGLYTLENSMSPKFKRTLPLIYGPKCKASRGVRIHKGNTWKDSAGCVLVGMGADYAKHRLVSSAEAETMVKSLAWNNTQLAIVEG